MNGAPLAVEREQRADGGRYVVYLPDGLAAEMTYRSDGRVLTIDHTFTPPEHRGRNVAAALMTRLVAEARAEGMRVVPLCSYAAAQFHRHPEWADLLAENAPASVREGPDRR